MNQFKETSYSKFEYDIGNGDVLMVNAAAHQAIQKMLTEARAAALEEAAEWFLYEDNKHLFHSEMLWPHQVAERLRQLKDKP